MKTKYRVKHGGLVRRCLLSLDDAMVNAEYEPTEGDKLRCTSCKDEPGLIYTGGSWQWATPTPEPPRMIKTKETR